MKNSKSTLIGMLMKQIRTEHGLSQEEVSKRWPKREGSDGKVAEVGRTVYAKYESGILTPSDERIKEFASIFNI